MYQPDETPDNTLTQTTTNASQQTPPEANTHAVVDTDKTTRQHLRACVGQLIMQLLETYSVVSSTEKQLICKLGLMYMTPTRVCQTLQLSLSSVIEEITQILQILPTLTTEALPNCPRLFGLLIKFPGGHDMAVMERIYSEELYPIKERLRVRLRKSDRLIDVAGFFGKINAVEFLQQIQEDNANQVHTSVEKPASSDNHPVTSSHHDLYASSSYASLQNSPSPDLFINLSEMPVDIDFFDEGWQQSYEDAYPFATSLHMPMPQATSQLQWQHLNAEQQQAVLTYVQSKSDYAFIYSNELAERLEEHGVKCAMLTLTSEQIQRLPTFWQLWQLVQNANLGDLRLTFNIILVRQKHFDYGMALDLGIVSQADFLHETATSVSASGGHIATTPTSSSSRAPYLSSPTSSSTARTPSPPLGRYPYMFQLPATSSQDASAPESSVDTGLDLEWIESLPGSSADTGPDLEWIESLLEQSLHDLEFRPPGP